MKQFGAGVDFNSAQTVAETGTDGKQWPAEGPAYLGRRHQNGTHNPLDLIGLAGIRPSPSGYSGFNCRNFWWPEASIVLYIVLTV